MSAPWRRVDEPAQRDRLLDAAIEHALSVRAAAEGREPRGPRMRRGEIWVCDTVTGEVRVWAIPEQQHVIIADITAEAGAESGPLMRALAQQAGWQGVWRFSSFAGDTALAELAEATEAHRVATKMQLEVAAVPEPVGIRLRAIDDAEYAAYREVSDEAYAQERLASGSEPTIEEARAFAAEQMQQLLPDGPHTEGHRLWTVRDDDDARVGLLWVHLRERDAFIYDIEMDADRRGQGWGTQTLRAAAAETRRAGLDVLALNVFGSNDAARRLYSREGYRETEVLWSAPIG